MARLWSFDLDGVLAEPPFGWNPAINRDVSLMPAADAGLPLPDELAATVEPALFDRLLTHTWYRARYLLRPPRPGALDAVRCASKRGRAIVLTGRHERGRRQTLAWLERHGFAELIDQLIMNRTPLSSARYKEAYLRHAGPQLHVDDDAATAALLARNGIGSALVDWPRNRALDYPPSVIRCADLQEVRAAIEGWPLDD